jgi:hypothetical protein
MKAKSSPAATTPDAMTLAASGHELGQISGTE